MNLDLLLSHRSLRLGCFSSRILYCLGWRMSTDPSSSSLSSSVISILLFSPSSEPFTSVFVFFSPNIFIWLFHSVFCLLVDALYWVRQKVF